MVEGHLLVLECLAGLLVRQNVETYRSQARDFRVHRLAPEAQVVQPAPSFGEGKDRRSRIGRPDKLDR
jgi:hypothetical protein